MSPETAELLGQLGEGLFFYGFMPVFTLTLIVAVHEYGHYWAARRCGVKVTKFSVGFGREIFGFNDKHGTRWSFAWIPLGGYVKIFGDVDKDNPVVWDKENNCERRLSQKELDEAFCTKTVWQRMGIVFAGPAINLVSAYVILMLLFMLYGQNYSYPQINALGVNSSSYRDGFRLGDVILEMDGKKIERFSQVYDRTWNEPKVPFTYKVLRDGKEIEIVSASDAAKYTDVQGVEREHGRTGMVHFVGIAVKDIKSVDGVGMATTGETRARIKQSFDRTIALGLFFRDNIEDYFLVNIPASYNRHLDNPKHKYYENIFLNDPQKLLYHRMGLLDAGKEAAIQLWQAVEETYKVLSVAYKGKTKQPVIGGVAKISESVARAAKEGIYLYVIFAVVFSLMLAVINLLPIPLLDGGFIMFLLYEACTGRPVSQKVQDYAIIIGLVLLGGIMVFANVSDFLRLLG